MKILSFILLFTLSCNGVFAMGQKKDPDTFEDFHKEIYTHYLSMEKHMDEIFDEHKKYTESMQKKMFQSNASVKVKQLSECRYKITFPDFNKSDVLVSFDDNILSVAGQKTNKNKDSKHNANFLYNFSVSHNCKGKPDIKYTKNGVEVTFNITTQD
jgi:HSP20 family molecular chaperone IbpA